MTTQWTVVTPASRVALDAHRRGEVTVNVTNAGQNADVAVFGAVAGDGADPSWFSVADPQRPVPPGGTVQYLLNIGVPAQVPPGRYAVAGRVYSANQPPEETSRTSGWILFDVAPAGAARPAPQPGPPPAAPPRPPQPRRQHLLPIVAVAAVGLVAVIVLGWTVIWPMFAKHEGVIESTDMRVLPGGIGLQHRQPCCGEPSATGGTFLYLEAWQVGHSGTAEFVLPDGGRFNISAIRSTSWNNGVVLLTIDGKQVGEEFDGYANVQLGFTDWVRVGTVELDEGPHELTMTAVGESPDAHSRNAGIDAIRYESA
jgi:hypothetical protein